MTLAFVFAGQGAEEPRMGLDVAAGCARAAELLAIASVVTGHDVPRALARGLPAGALQAALVAVQLGAVAALADRNVRPDIVAGHSLGEVAAWALAAGISADQAVRIAAVRGRAMAVATGGLLAVSRVPELPDRVVVAACNAADEFVLSGPIASLEAIRAAVGGTIVQRAGAWHHPELAAAVPALRAAIPGVVPGGGPRWIASGDGEFADPADGAAKLGGQLTGPVRFVAVCARLWGAGVRDVVVPGPGRAIRSLLRRNLPGLRVHAADDQASIEALAPFAR